MIGLLLLLQQTREYTGNNPGTLLSAWGLYVSIFVFYLAKGAKSAAEDARTELKATIALQELILALEKNKQIAVYAMASNWVGVRILAEDIMNRCNHTARRWQDDDAFTSASQDLARVTNNMQSIITAVDKPTSKRMSTVLSTQAEASRTLSGVTGLIEKELRSGHL